MRIPLDWLKKYIDITVPEEKLIELLTMSGTEIERVAETSGLDFEKVVVGEILTIEKHPNADKLQVLSVEIGIGKTLTIVCGASNVEVGQKVPVALVGARLGDFEIKEVEIRGVKSSGMLCSESELGISDDHSGIMILDVRASIGTVLSQVLNKESQVFEAEITPNRGDCLSMIGVARELSALIGKEVKVPESQFQEEEQAPDLKIQIEDANLCYRYMGRVISGIRIQASPSWLVSALASYGMRSVNNIVDVTNYVMIELGHPLHAFDYDIITGTDKKTIRIRRALAGEELTTLDGVKRRLDSGMLLIADQEKVLGLAGVMGGKDSEISDQTVSIFLESANFNPTSIRKTGKFLGLRSEASNRFEKGLPLELTEAALDRAAFLIKEIVPEAKISPVIAEGQKPGPEKKVVLEASRIESFLGEKISLKEASELLRRLGFGILKASEKDITVQVPFWRLDVSIEEDLLEEVARLYGYNNFPTTMPRDALGKFEPNPQIETVERLRNLLVSRGFFEVYSYSFTNQADASRWRQEQTIRIANPLSQEQEYLRTDLLGSFLNIISKNKDYSYDDYLKIFEISPVYLLKGKNVSEELKLTGLIYGRGQRETFLEVKSVARFLSDSLNLAEDIKVKILPLGSRLLKEKGVKAGQAAIFEADIAEIIRQIKPRKYRPISKFPSATRDLSVEVAEKIRMDEILKLVQETAGHILTDVRVVEVFRGKAIGQDKKSVLLRFNYQSKDRTLTDEEIEADQDRIIENIRTKIGGQLRGVK